MIVAVIFACVMQVTSYYIVCVVAVRHSVVPACRRVFVGGIVTVALVLWCAAGSIGSADGNGVVMDMVIVHVVHVTIMEIIFVTIMFYGFVATAFTVCVIVVFMLTVAAHHLLLHNFIKSLLVIASRAFFLYLSAINRRRQHHIRHHFFCILQNVGPVIISVIVKSSKTPVGCALAIVSIFMI